MLNSSYQLTSERELEWFEHFHPAPNPNRGRLCGTAPSLTFGAQTGRGSDRSYVIKRTLDHNFHPLITLVHELAQNAVGPMLPYLGFQILRLGVGQSLNQHRDYHNHPDDPNHTMTSTGRLVADVEKRALVFL